MVRDGVFLVVALLVGCSNESERRSNEPLPMDGAAGATATGGSSGATTTDGASTGGTSSSDAGVQMPTGSDGGFVFTPKLPPELCEASSQTTTLEQVQAVVTEALQLTPDALVNRYPVTYQNDLGYSPSTASALDLIQASSLALNSDELAHLETNGFVLSDRQRFPTFFYGYKTIYAADLPLYVTVDSVLHAVHRSYDDILKSLEYVVLEPQLGTFLDDLRTKLAGAGLPTETAADLDVYLAVAKSLLDQSVAGPVAGGAAVDIDTLYALASAAAGMQTVDLFGTQRSVDFSQFVPRGHYTGDLSAYFQAMMWLGRIDLRMVETDEFGQQLLRRRQVAAALAFDEVMDTSLDETWGGIDRVLNGFVGEIDSMTPPQVPALEQQLGITTVAELAGIDDATLKETILSAQYGMQRIASHLMVSDVIGTLPLNRSFTVFGQRYTVDSHVFSNVVYDRVEAGTVKRMMPDPLDVAFAALGNDEALALVAPQFATYDYAGELGAMRALIDAHDCSFFDSNLYTLWLGALRALSPTSEVSDPGAVGLPSITGTEAWGRRLLGTQLASWAELRHDTLLYAKQSYTGIPGCDFPDAYVDPYPDAFDRIAAFGLRGRELVDALPRTTTTAYTLDGISAYFSHLYDVALLLKQIAEFERSGSPVTAEQLAFINNAVIYKSEDVVCTTIDVPAGWYPELFYDPDQSDEYDPTIADVHTQPADEVGIIVGRVLHVGTGMPRLFVTTVDTCTGPRAYAGVASAYFERTTDNFERLTDEQWATELETATPSDPAWMSNLVSR